MPGGPRRTADRSSRHAASARLRAAAGRLAGGGAAARPPARSPFGGHRYADLRIQVDGKEWPEEPSPCIGCGNVADPREGIRLAAGEVRCHRLDLDRTRLPAVGAVQVALALRWHAEDRGYPEGELPDLDFGSGDGDEGLFAFLPAAAELRSAPVTVEFRVPDSGPARAQLDHVPEGRRPVDALPGLSAKEADLLRRGVQEHEAGTWGASTVYELSYDWRQPVFHLESMEADGWTSLVDRPIPLLIAEVEGWQRDRWIDDAVYGVARLLQARGYPWEARLLLVYTAARWPYRDHGIRARAWLEGREAGAPALD